MTNDYPIASSGRVAIAGDWHGNVRYIGLVIARLRERAPDVDTIFQLGDFGHFPKRTGRQYLSAIDSLCADAGIKRVFVIPGNHEDWTDLDRLFAANPAEPVQLSETVTVLPRVFRFDVGGRTFLSFGGAASVDFEWRTTGRTWWPSEAPTEANVEDAIAGGPVDVLLAHETVNGGTEEVERILRSNPRGFSWEARAYSEASRDKVTRVWDALRPTVLAHGHMHVRGEIRLPDGRRVYSFAANGLNGGLAVLDPQTLAWEWLDQ